MAAVLEGSRLLLRLSSALLLLAAMAATAARGCQLAGAAEACMAVTGTEQAAMERCLDECTMCDVSSECAVFHPQRSLQNGGSFVFACTHDCSRQTDRPLLTAPLNSDLLLNAAAAAEETEPSLSSHDSDNHLKLDNTEQINPPRVLHLPSDSDSTPTSKHEISESAPSAALPGANRDRSLLSGPETVSISAAGLGVGAVRPRFAKKAMEEEKEAARRGLLSGGQGGVRLKAGEQEEGAAWERSGRMAAVSAHHFGAVSGEGVAERRGLLGGLQRGVGLYPSSTFRRAEADSSLSGGEHPAVSRGRLLAAVPLTAALLSSEMTGDSGDLIEGMPSFQGLLESILEEGDDPKLTESTLSTYLQAAGQPSPESTEDASNHELSDVISIAFSEGDAASLSADVLLPHRRRMLVVSDNPLRSVGFYGGSMLSFILMVAAFATICSCLRRQRTDRVLAARGINPYYGLPGATPFRGGPPGSVPPPYTTYPGAVRETA